MATTAHCLFCFETLAAQFEKRKAMRLAEVKKSWIEYKDGLDKAASSSSPAKQVPALRCPAESSICSPAASVASSTTALRAGSDDDGGSVAPATSLSSLSSVDFPSPAVGEKYANGPDESPLFVTWKVLSRRDGNYHLRGCVGTFESLPLEESLSSYAVTAAIHDGRFEPVSPRELPRLEACVTLLTDFEDAAGAEDWELGRHGLRIYFYLNGRRYSATYLPDVAPEQGWDKEETIVSLMRKAGWTGRKDEWRKVELTVVRYQGRKATLEYGNFKAWRDWVDKVTGGKK